MIDKKIELITQMLAKAESTTPEEAEALTEHAERLMLKYNIDQAVIDAAKAKSGKPSDAISSTTITFTGAYRLEHTTLGYMAALGLGNIRCAQTTYKNKMVTLHMFGFQSDLDQAKLLIMSLQVQATVAVRAWWKVNSVDFALDSSYDQEAARRSFVKGFGLGAGARIRASRVVIVQEAGTGAELVLVGRKDQVDKHFATVSLTKSRARGGKGDSGASASGYAAGQQANTGQKVSKGVTA